MNDLEKQADLSTAPAIKTRFHRDKLSILILCGLIISAAFMIVGHYLIMKSGAVFNPVNGERYNPSTRWVSDFAAKKPEGIWIKMSILIFCVALTGFYRRIIEVFSRARFGGLMKFVWLLLAAAMIGGLCLVVLFDTSAPQFIYKDPPWLRELFGAKGEYVIVSPGNIEWVERWYHQLGFWMFLCSFYLSAVMLAAAEWVRGIKSAIPTTVFFIALAAMLQIWLFRELNTIAGVPQRLLLVIIFVWVGRNVVSLQRMANYSK